MRSPTNRLWYTPMSAITSGTLRGSGSGRLRSLPPRTRGAPPDRGCKSPDGVICSVPNGFPWRIGFRWMPGRATVRLGGPRSAKDQLLLEGHCPKATKSGRCASFSIGRRNTAGECTNYPSGKRFPSSIRFAAFADGKTAVTVAIAVDQVIHEPGGRELGLTFGTIAIRVVPNLVLKV